MRYLVTYTKPDGIEGARLFDVDNASLADPAVGKAARAVVGEGAKLTSIGKNDGRTRIGEGPDFLKNQLA